MSAANNCLASLDGSSEAKDSLSDSRESLVNLYDSRLRSEEYWSLLEKMGDSND